VGTKIAAHLPSAVSPSPVKTARHRGAGLLGGAELPGEDLDLVTRWRGAGSTASARDEEDAARGKACGPPVGHCGGYGSGPRASAPCDAPRPVPVPVELERLRYCDHWPAAAETRSSPQCDAECQRGLARWRPGRSWVARLRRYGSPHAGRQSTTSAPAVGRKATGVPKPGRQAAEGPPLVRADGTDSPEGRIRAARRPDRARGDVRMRPWSIGS